MRVGVVARHRAAAPVRGDGRAPAGPRPVRPRGPRPRGARALAARCAAAGRGPHAPERLRGLVVRVARRVGRGQFDPEDLAHGALERWLRGAPRLTAVANPRAWITVVLRRLLVDRMRRRRAAAEVSTDCAALAI